MFFSYSDYDRFPGRQTIFASGDAGHVLVLVLARSASQAQHPQIFAMLLTLDLLSNYYQ